MYDRIFNLLRARPGHWLVYLLFGLSAFPASAAVTLSQFPPNPGVLPGGGWQFTSGTTFANPPPPRAWVNGVYGGVPSATVSDALTLSGRAGSLAVTARTTVSAVEVALALARVAGGVGTAVAVGSLAYDLLAGAGVRNTPGGAEIDPGSPPVDGIETQWRASFGDTVGPWAGSKAAAAGALAGSLPKTVQWSDCQMSATYSTPDSVTGQFVETNSGCTNSVGIFGGAGTYSHVASFNSEARQVTGCSPIVDALTGQTYVPGVRSDGKCMTGRYAAATSAAQIATALKPVVDSDVSKAAKAAIAAGGEIESSGFGATGPASQIGTPTSSTTTAPDGTTTTTTTTPTYNYTYDGDKVTYTTTNETKVCTGANSCTTTTTTTAPTTKQDPADPCTADPTRAGCTDLGDPNLKDKVPDDPWTFPGIIAKTMPSNKSCPSPITVNIPHGPAVVFSFEPLCDICANYISKIVSVMSILTAVSVFVRSFKV